MKNKKVVILILIIVVVSLFLILCFNALFSGKAVAMSTDSVQIKSVDNNILAEGKIASQNEATLHFQTGGKLTRLAAKEGDKVTENQTIANLDTYALQRQLTAALNVYRSTRDTFDQTQQNTTNGVAVGSQRYGLEVGNKANLSGQNETDIINDMVKRLVDQNQANLDNSVINVELANYALELSSLTAPFNGIVVHEDVTQPGVNVTPQTSFIIIDPTALVFRAQVNEQDIDFVSVGSKAVISIDGDNTNYDGYVSKIYPEKITLPNGQNVYNVDVSGNISNKKYAQAGSVQIQSNAAIHTKLVPRWTVLNGQSIWVKNGSSYQLRTVRVGKTHGDLIEILDGLSSTDKIVVAPQTVIQNKYTIL